jgi:hypothetical protein
MVGRHVSSPFVPFPVPHVDSEAKGGWGVMLGLEVVLAGHNWQAFGLRMVDP